MRLLGLGKSHILAKNSIRQIDSSNEINLPKITLAKYLHNAIFGFPSPKSCIRQGPYVHKFWKVNFKKIGLHQSVLNVDYLLDCTSFWIQCLYICNLLQNEQRSHSSLWWCQVVWNDNILQSLEMLLNHHHTWLICQS